MFLDRAAWRRLVPLLDLVLLAALVICWATVAVAVAHLVSGVILIGMFALHVATRPGLARLRRRPATSRAAVTAAMGWLLLAAAAAVTLTGLLRWAGMPPRYTWHGGTGWLLVFAVLAHLWQKRRRLPWRRRGARRRRVVAGS